MASKSTIKINDREVELRYTNASTARLQSLRDGAPPARDFKNPKKAFFALCAWTWAMLPREVFRDYENPAELADVLDMANIEQYFTAITAAMEAAQPTEEGKATPSA